MKHKLFVIYENKILIENNKDLFLYKKNKNKNKNKFNKKKNKYISSHLKNKMNKQLLSKNYKVFFDTIGNSILYEYDIIEQIIILIDKFNQQHLLNVLDYFINRNIKTKYGLIIVIFFIFFIFYSIFIFLSW